MFLAFFIYNFLLYISIAVSYIAKKYFYFVFIFIIFITSLILGLRYNVGVDYLSYLNEYKFFSIFNYSFEDFEWGFNLITSFFSNNGFHFSLYFIFLNLIIWFFLLLSIKDFKYILVFFIFFIYTDGFLFFSLNGIRQAISISLIFYSFRFIYVNNFYKFIFFVLLSFLFHKASIVFVLFYFFVNKDIFPNRLYTIFIVLCFYFIDTLDYVKNISVFVSEILGYQFYAKNIELAFDNRISINSGFGVLFRNFIYLLCIIYSDKLKNIFPFFIPYYNVFVFGVILSHVFSDIHLLHRFNNYLIFFRIFVLSFLSYYLFYLSKSISNYLIGLFLLICYFMFFLYSISTSFSLSSPFNFYFDY
ncbi:EpsG family protein [Algoriphagus sp. CAU 1675]|uniref:EpsG family protein n=1 Tax=Algoriphagus sp. CAU 1675 TaxID=3032597 RepID=UPI0023DC805E|nr:EpsG family protein [Algoriphagus sp. CAU 1675]MDF2158189.1 EpsG family protein [Algoriphagus sp. CAU 1675]